jgi:hypothetical protein
MSDRKLRTITISATMRHEARGLTARSRRRKRPAISTERVRQHRERRRQGVIELRIVVSERELIEALPRRLRPRPGLVDGNSYDDAAPAVCGLWHGYLRYLCAEVERPAT